MSNLLQSSHNKVVSQTQDFKGAEKHSLGDIERIAAAIAKSNLFGIKTPEQALVLCLIAQAEGLHPALAAMRYNIIGGKPAKTAEAMMRDFLQAGGKVIWHCLTDKVAEATFSHPSGGEVRIKWDMATATQAGLSGKDNWKKTPRAMLRSRVVSEGVRTVCPMATSGMYLPEEVQDFSDPKDDNRGYAGIKGAPERAPDFISTSRNVTPQKLEVIETKPQPESPIDSPAPLQEKVSEEIKVLASELRRCIHKICHLTHEGDPDRVLKTLTGSKKATLALLDEARDPKKLEALISKANEMLERAAIENTEVDEDYHEASN